MPETVVIAQRPGGLDEIQAQLLEHFKHARAALLGGSRVLIEVHGADLLGQGTVADAALACALLGLARGLAIEGARSGWSINVVATGVDRSGSLSALIDERLTGQLIYTDEGHLGRVRS